MNPPVLRTLLCLVSAVALTQTSPAALIANWDFNTGTDADLNSSVGGYSFARLPGVGPGVGNDPTYNVGSISLDRFTELVASGINSTALPGLKSNATIYMRMKFDAPLAAGGGFFAGFQNSFGPSSFEQQALVGFAYDTTHIAGYGFTNTGAGAFAGNGLLPAPETYFTLALVVTAGVSGPGTVQYTMNLNGVEILSGTTGDTMQAFQTFAIGQLAASQGVAPMTFDQIQVYDTSLTAAEIAAIPEPSTILLATIGGVSLLGLRKRRKP